MADITVSYKGSTIAEVSASGTTTLGTSGKYCEDDISIAYTKPSGGASQPSKDVNFYDYDGTIVASYTAADFANLSALPDNPTHTGLTAQGWNWTLSDAKAQVALAGFLNIGQMYVTSDGKTRLYVTLEKTRLSPTVSICPNGTVVIDWGDGSTDTVTGTSHATKKDTQHTYSSEGNYVITFEVTSGTCRLGYSASGITSVLFWANTGVDLESQAYRNAVKRIEIGSNVTIYRATFMNMTALESVTIPTSITAIDDSSFCLCRSLKYLALPDTITSFGTSVFRDCTALQNIATPKTLPMKSETFRFDQSSERKTISSVSTIENRCFQDNYAVTKFVIPDTVTSIGTEAFSGCYSAKEYHLKPTNPPTLSNTNTFTGIPSDCVIYVPSASLATYQGASIWSDFASYMVGE